METKEIKEQVNQYFMIDDKVNDLLNKLRTLSEKSTAPLYSQVRKFINSKTYDKNEKIRNELRYKISWLKAEYTTTLLDVDSRGEEITHTYINADCATKNAPEIKKLEEEDKVVSKKMDKYYKRAETKYLKYVNSYNKKIQKQRNSLKSEIQKFQLLLEEKCFNIVSAYGLTKYIDEITEDLDIKSVLYDLSKERDGLYCHVDIIKEYTVDVDDDFCWDNYDSHSYEDGNGVYFINEEKYYSALIEEVENNINTIPNDRWEFNDSYSYQAEIRDVPTLVDLSYDTPTSDDPGGWYYKRIENQNFTVTLSIEFKLIKE